MPPAFGVTIIIGKPTLLHELGHSISENTIDRGREIAQLDSGHFLYPNAIGTLSQIPRNTESGSLKAITKDLSYSHKTLDRRIAARGCSTGPLR